VVVPRNVYRVHGRTHLAHVKHAQTFQPAKNGVLKHHYLQLLPLHQPEPAARKATNLKPR